MELWCPHVNKISPEGEEPGFTQHPSHNMTGSALVGEGGLEVQLVVVGAQRCKGEQVSHVAAALRTGGAGAGKVDGVIFCPSFPEV